MKNKGVIIGIISIASGFIATGVVIYLVKKNQLEKRLTRVAEEGYETAQDILYPKRKYRPFKSY